MTTHDHDDVVLKQQLQEYYKGRCGQPPAAAAFWERLSPRLEARIQPARRQYRLRQALWPAGDTRSTSPRVAPSGRVGRLAAFVVVCVLVGSLIIVFQLATQKSHTPTGQGALGGVTDLYLSTVHNTHGTGVDSVTLTRIVKATQKRVWQRTIQWTTNTPHVVGDSAYGTTSNTTNSQQTVYALNLRDGSIRWSVVVGPGDFLTEPAVWGGSVYVWHWKGLLYCLDSATGKTNWVYDSKLIPYQSGGGLVSPGSVAVANGIVYNTVLNTLLAVDAKAGKLLWSKTLDSKLIFTFLAPVVSDDTIYVSSYTQASYSTGPSFVYALDERSGAQKWAYKMDGFVTPPVVAAGNRVFFLNPYPIALDATTGKLIWSQATSCFPAAVEKVLYLLCADGSKNADTSLLRALDPATGKTLWSRASVYTLYPRDEIVYAVVANQIVALQAHNGQELWHIQLTGYGSFYLWYVS